MKPTTATLAVAVLAGMAFLAAAEPARHKEDDLALVKRAVAESPATTRVVAGNAAAAPAAGPQAETKTSPRASSRGADPQWLKVRVVDKVTGKKKVTVNMPLSLVRALGDEMPIDWPCGGAEAAHVRSTLKLSQVLAALEAGQDLVQVDDEDSEVRVWVE